MTGWLNLWKWIHMFVLSLRGLINRLPISKRGAGTDPARVLYRPSVPAPHLEVGVIGLPTRNVLWNVEGT